MPRRHIVVVGGGTSGSVVAQSLAHATEHDIVIVEPGPLSNHDDAHRFFDVLNNVTLHTIHEVTMVDGGPLAPYVQARSLGGGSAINGMLLTGDTPDYVQGLVRAPRDEEIGQVGRALLKHGGRPSTMWWNNGRWNPGRGVQHLVEEGRVRLIDDDVENLVVDNGSVIAVETRSTFVPADVVVLCTGALVTPQILLRSGLGHHNDMIGIGLQIIHQ